MAWEHRTLTLPHHKKVGLNPNENYVTMLEEVSSVLKKHGKKRFDHKRFLKRLPKRGPWQENKAGTKGGDIRKDPRTRYVGSAESTLVNTSLVLGSSWIDPRRFEFERFLNNMYDFLWQKNVLFANLWSPTRLLTTQTMFCCASGDEANLGGAFGEEDTIPSNHLLIGGWQQNVSDWKPILYGTGHRGIVEGSDPQERVWWPALSHRDVTYDSRWGWVRFSPAGFGKDSTGFLATKPYQWITPAVDGSKDNPTPLNLLSNISDRKIAFGEEAISDVYTTTGKTSIYVIQAMTRSPQMRALFGSGDEIMPLEFHVVEPGFDEFLQQHSDEDRYGRLFESCVTLGFLMTDPEVGKLGGMTGRRRVVIYSLDQAGLLTGANLSQVADLALRNNYTSTVFTKLDMADFMARTKRRFNQYADLIADADIRWITRAETPDGRMVGPKVHSILSCRAYETITFDEYLATFDAISAASERVMNRILESTMTMALKPVMSLDHIAPRGMNPYEHLFKAEASGNNKQSIFYMEVRFFVPTSIDRLRVISGQTMADREMMRERFGDLTGIDGMTGMSVLDCCMPFAPDLGSDAWQQRTGLREDEVTVEVTFTINPEIVWRTFLEPTIENVHELPRGFVGTAANIWGDAIMTNDKLLDAFKKNNLEHWVTLLRLAYYWSYENATKKHGLK